MIKSIKFIMIRVRYLTALALMVGLTGFTFGYDLHEEVQDRAVRTNMHAMATFEVQNLNFVFYTLNVGTPGFMETGVYNTRRKNGKVEFVPFYRWRAGPPVETGRYLDFYLDAASRGFFVIQLPGALGFTRDGRFRIDSRNRLVTLSGSYPVIGSQGQIYFPEDTQVQDISVSRAGLIYLNNQEVDRFRVAVFKSFKDMQTMESLNGSFFVLTKPIETLEGPEYYKILQGWLEQNNVLKAITGDGRMASMGFDANAKTAHLLNRVLSNSASLASP